MTADVVVAFRDRRTWVAYEPGDAYEANASRVAELRSLGILAGGEAAQDAGPEDLAALTVTQLRELCDVRGIEVPKKATKAQLVALLGR